MNTQSQIINCDKCTTNVSGHVYNKMISHDKTCINVLHEKEMCNNWGDIQ